MITTRKLIADAWEHLSQTMRRSTTDYGACCYGGSGCALAPQIPENLRDLAEECSPHGLYDRCFILEPFEDDGDAARLQACHDRTGDIEGPPFLQEFAGNVFTEFPESILPAGLLELAKAKPL